MPPTPAGQLAVPNLHRAARIEDAVHQLVERRLRRTGWQVNIIAYTGYGAPGWVRVMCRVLLGRPDTRQRRPAGEGARLAQLHHPAGQARHR